MKSKKILALLLTVCVISSFFLATPISKGASEDILTVKIDNIKAEKGATFELPVSLSNNTLGLCGLTLNFKYDSKYVIYQGAQNGTALSSMELTKPGTTFSNGNITFDWNSVEPYYTNGNILYISFAVAENAPAAVFEIEVSVKTAYDANGDIVETKALSGTLTVIVEKPHKHSYGRWTYEDEYSHKQVCSCGDVAIVKHIWDTGIITKAPTTTTTGIKKYKCYMCRFEKEEVVPVLLTTFTAGNARAEPKETITIPITLETNLDGIRGLTLNFKYDADILAYQRAEKGEALPDMELTMLEEVFIEGDITFTWDNMFSDYSTGEILSIIFKVKDDAPAGDYKFDIIVEEVFDCAYVDIEYRTISGKVTVDEPIHDHKYGEWQECVGIKGLQYHKKICECGREIKEKHTIEEVVTKEATCESSGIMTVNCTICNYTYTIQILKTDHDWDEGAVTTEPTTSAEGVKTYTCSVCGGTKTEAIDKLTPANKAGDLDGDGGVKVDDVILIRRFITSGFSVTVNEDAADVNKDSRVDVKDVVLIRRFIVGGYGVEL